MKASRLCLGVIVSISFGFPLAFSHVSAQAEPAKLKYGVAYAFALQGAYVLGPTDDSKSGIGQVLSQGSETAGDSLALYPWGFELWGDYRWHPEHAVGIAMRGLPATFRFTPSDASQRAFDAMVTLSYRFQHSLGNGRTLGLDAGFRMRGWLMSDGLIPSSGHAGGVVGLSLLWHPIELLGEAGLMALGLGPKETLGTQRDGSTLRFRGGFHLPLSESFVLVPFAELMHTHRSFFASNLRPSHAAFFWDQVTVLLGIELRGSAAI